MRDVDCSPAQSTSLWQWSRVLLCCLSTGCGGRSGDTPHEVERTSQGSHLLTPDIHLGSIDGTGPESFADIRALAVDSAGSIYVLERSTPEVRVFDRTGAFAMRWGRQGQGPGEFEDPVGLVVDDQHRIWVVDQGNSRFTSFAPDGRYISSIPRLFPGFNVDTWKGTLSPSGEFTDVVSRPFPIQSTLLFHMVAGRSGVQDSLVLPPFSPAVFEFARGNTNYRAAIPFAPRQEWVIDRSGSIWLGTTDAYSIVRISFRGDTLARIHLPVSPVAVRPEERAEAIARLDWFVKQGGTVDPSRIPGHKPAFSRLAVDDANRLWVQVEADVPADVAVFDIFDSTGSRISNVAGRLGVLLRAPIIVGGRIYATVADSDGMESVVSGRVSVLEPAK